MFNRAPTRTRGVPGTPRALLRPLVVVLALLQLVAPVSAAVADPPPAPVTHADHLGEPDERGCEPFHDDAFCVTCRVLFSQPLGSRSAPAIGSPLHDGGARVCDGASAIPEGPTDTPLHARAPPLV